MRRLLLTLSDTRCPFRCQYCFAEFRQYERPLSFTDVESAPEALQDVEVIYPACDVDLFATREPMETLWRAARLDRSISVSTKARLSEEVVSEIARVSRYAREHNHILKIGVSMSTKYECARLESGAADYPIRLRNLKLLSEASVPTCLVLKPILVDIPPLEYCEILSDCATFTRHVLIGDEYLDIDHPRLPNGLVSLREVPWAKNHPVWPTISSVEHHQAIKGRAAALGLDVFESDLDLMSALTKLSSERNAVMSGVIDPC